MIQAPNVSPEEVSELEQRNPRSITAFLEQYRERITKVCSKHITPDVVISSMNIALIRDPKLCECTTTSLLQAALNSAYIGLEVSGNNNIAFLMPFRKKIKYPNGGEDWVSESKLMPGYNGLIQLACRSPEILRFDLRTVYEGDYFDVQEGTVEQIEHTPNLDADRSKKGLYWYCIVRYANGGNQFVWMNEAQVERIRGYSDAGKKRKAGKKVYGDTWEEEGNYNEMAMKSCVRSIFKRLPVSPETAYALNLVDEADPLPQERGGEVVPQKVEGAEGDDLAEQVRASNAQKHHAVEAAKDAESPPEAEGPEESGDELGELLDGATPTDEPHEPDEYSQAHPEEAPASSRLGKKR